MSFAYYERATICIKTIVREYRSALNFYLTNSTLSKSLNSLSPVRNLMPNLFASAKPMQSAIDSSLAVPTLYFAALSQENMPAG